MLGQPRPTDRSSERAPREAFRFVEAEKGARVERPITPVDQAPKIELAPLVKTFFHLSRERTSGSDRTEDAGFQNRLARGILSGVITNPSRFSSEFGAAISKEAEGKRVRDIIVAGERVDIGVYWRKIWDGIIASVDEAKALRREFLDRPGSPGDRQFLGMNDVLDATKKIDLIDLRYRTARAGEEIGQITNIRLVQVKRGGKALDPIEVRSIIRAHQEYVEQLASRESVLAQLRHEAVSEKAVTGRLFREGAVERADDPAAMLEYIESFFGDAVLSVLGEDQVEPSAIDRYWHGRDSRACTIAKIFFSHKNGARFVSYLADRVGDPDSASRAIQALRAWAGLRQPSAEEIRGLDPDWTPSPDLLSATKFTSVIREAGRETSTVLEFQGEKVVRALTAD